MYVRMIVTSVADPDRKKAFIFLTKKNASEQRNPIPSFAKSRPKIHQSFTCGLLAEDQLFRQAFF